MRIETTDEDLPHDTPVALPDIWDATRQAQRRGRQGTRQRLEVYRGGCSYHASHLSHWPGDTSIDALRSRYHRQRNRPPAAAKVTAEPDAGCAGLSPHEMREGS